MNQIDDPNYGHPYKFDMPEKKIRTAKLLRVVTLDVNTIEPEYKIKISRKGKVKVKTKKNRFILKAQIVVEREESMQIQDIWQSRGTNYIITTMTPKEANMVNVCSVLKHFSYPDDFVFIASTYSEGGKP